MFGTSTGTVKIYELNTFELAAEIPYIPQKYDNNNNNKKANFSIN